MIQVEIVIYTGHLESKKRIVLEKSEKLNLTHGQDFTFFFVGHGNMYET